MKIPKHSEYPKQLWVKGDSYKILFVKNLKFLGETDSEKHTIKIKAGMSKNETFRTFIHEALHALEFSYPIKIKHKTVYKLEKAIFQLFIDNFL